MSSVLAILPLPRNRSNTSLGNKPFSIKKEVYPHSKFLLTKLICMKPRVGERYPRSIERFAELKPFNNWTSSTIEDRQIRAGEVGLERLANTRTRSTIRNHWKI